VVDLREDAGGCVDSAVHSSVFDKTGRRDNPRGLLSYWRMWNLFQYGLFVEREMERRDRLVGLNWWAAHHGLLRNSRKVPSGLSHLQDGSLR